MSAWLTIIASSPRPFGSPAPRNDKKPSHLQRGLFVGAMVVIFSLSSSAWAAYRVYEFKLTKKDPNTSVQSRETIRSNLAPSDYAQYHDVGVVVNVEIIGSWMCPGDTARFRTYCDPPDKKKSRKKR